MKQEFCLIALYAKATVHKSNHNYKCVWSFTARLNVYFTVISACTKSICSYTGGFVSEPEGNNSKTRGLFD